MPHTHRYVLGGGFGSLVRYGGLGSTNIISMEVVTADGKVLQVCVRACEGSRIR